MQDERGDMLTANSVPVEIRKALPQQELEDRVRYARELIRSAATAADPVERESWGRIAKAMLAARPRDDVDREVAKKAFAAVKAKDPRQSAAIWAQIRKLQADNPPAPQYAGKPAAAAPARVAKGKCGGKPKDSGQVLVYDAHGQPYGTVDPADVNRVTPITPAGADAVAKAARGPKGRARR